MVALFLFFVVALKNEDLESPLIEFKNWDTGVSHLTYVYSSDETSVYTVSSECLPTL